MGGMAAPVHPWGSQGYDTAVQKRSLDTHSKAQDLLALLIPTG